MSNRFNNKNLIIILSGLIVLLLLTIVIKVPKQKSTLKEKLVDIDTTAVERIIFYPRNAKGKEFEFFRKDKKWNIKQAEIVSEPMKNAVKNIFTEILEIKPQSLAAVDKSSWENYEVTDSLATRIKFVDKKGNALADLMIGKFSYNQNANPYLGRGNNFSGTSFVRLYNESKVYAVDGFLALVFSGGFNDWRDKSFVRCRKEEITKISFDFPADSSYVLTKKDSVWYAGSQFADSASIEQYLNTLSFVDGEDFKDDFKVLSTPAYQLRVEGNNLLNITIKCFRAEDGKDLVFSSSQNSSVFFADNNKVMFDKLFKPVSYFLKKDKKKK